MPFEDALDFSLGFWHNITSLHLEGIRDCKLQSTDALHTPNLRELTISSCWILPVQNSAIRGIVLCAEHLDSFSCIYRDESEFSVEWPLRHIIGFHGEHLQRLTIVVNPQWESVIDLRACSALNFLGISPAHFLPDIMNVPSSVTNLWCDMARSRNEVSDVLTWLLQDKSVPELATLQLSTVGAYDLVVHQKLLGTQGRYMHDIDIQYEINSPP